MIRFTLSCAADHTFEAWFASSGDYEKQQERGLVSCPQCGSSQVEKALMAPAAVSSRGETEPMALAASDEQRQVMHKLKALSERLRENADYVGARFPEEARRIHFGETKPRGIYGEATSDEARSLAEDGIEFMPLPVFPDERN